MSRLFTIALGGIGCLALASVRASDEGNAPQPVGVASPDGCVRAEVLLRATSEGAAVPHYRVTLNGCPVILDSPLQVDLADGSTLGTDCTIESCKTTTLHAEYEQRPGKRSHIVDHCAEVIMSLRERAKPSRRWQLVIRAYDDGIALRYVLPAQDGWPSLVLAGERTVFTFPPDASAFALPLNSFTTSYEKRYEREPVKELPGDWLLGLPLLVKLPGTGWAAVTEANLTDYAGMYLARRSGEGAALVSRLSPRSDEPEVAVRAKLPHESPWRVVLLSGCVGKLIESDLVLNLNAPCAIADTSWIHPGKTTFPWWNGYYEEHVPFEPGLNTATVKYYIDFCAEAGIPYHSLDGKGHTAWYGGPIAPYDGADPTTAVEGLDLADVLTYAKSKGVRLRLWMHWEAAKAHMARAFPLYRDWGIEGVMIDFIDRDDQETLKLMEKVLKTAADNRLTVTLHGCPKPTGLERTYPNLLTSEAVLNLEYDKWDKLGVPPEHEVTVPFTRMLAGPLDFHQGSFRTVPVAEFKPRNEAPLIVGTPCRTLASYVVFQNHLSMVADYPSAYRGHPGLPVLAEVPTTWDETKFLDGAVGEFVVIARRRDADWWIGAMTNREARELRLPLAFLAGGRFRADLCRDDVTAAYGLRHETKEVAATDTIQGSLAPAGGLLIRLTPAGREPAVGARRGHRHRHPDG
jgi:alpha-glucosidase